MASKWKKAPEELTRRFQALLPQHPDVQARKMFGYACAFVRGNFWTGLFEDQMVVRLPEGLHRQFPEVADAAAFDPMGGRPMKGWFLIPPAVVANDTALLRFLNATFEAVRALPAKAGKQAAPRKAAPGTKAGSKSAAKKAAPKKSAAKKAAPKAPAARRRR